MQNLIHLFMNSCSWCFLLLDFTFNYMFCSLMIYIFMDFHYIWLPTFTVINIILNHILFIIKISLCLNLSSLGPTLVITSSGAVAGDGETKVHLPWVFYIFTSDFGGWKRSLYFADYIFTSHFQKVTVGSRQIGTQGNPSFPLRLGVYDP